jgi:hypothetical protein
MDRKRRNYSRRLAWSFQLFLFPGILATTAVVFLFAFKHGV